MTALFEYWKEIIGVAGVVTGYLFGVKKDKADIFSTMQKSYKTFIDDFNLKYELMQSQVRTMQKQIETFQENEENLRKLIQTMEIKITKLEQENRRLKTRLNKYEK